MHVAPKQLLTYPYILLIPGLLWMPVALRWSPTPMLSGLLLITAAAVIFGLLRGLRWLVLLAAMGYSAVLGLAEIFPEAPNAFPETVAWLCLAIAVSASTTGQPTLPSWHRVVAALRTQWAWYLGVGSVTVLACAVRAWQLSSIPLPISDESSAGLFSRTIWYGQFTNPFVSGWFEFPSLWFFLQAPFVGLYGTTFFAIRVFPMLLGTLCIPLLIWAVRPVLTRPAALSAGVALALLGMHVHFSRYGLNNIADSLSSIVLLGFVLRYMTRATAAHTTAIGLTLGTAIYGYASARIYPVIFFLVIVGLIIRTPRAWKLHLTNLAVAAAVALTVAGPLVLHYLQMPDQFWATVQRNSTLQRGDDGWTGFERNAIDNGISVPELAVRDVAYTLQALVWGPVEGWYATPRAILPPIGAALACLGLCWALWRRQGRVVVVTIAWLSVFCVLSSINWPVAAGQRLVGLLGILALLVGAGTQALMAVVPARVDRRVVSALAVVLTIAGGYQSLDHYFTVFVVREAGAGDPQLHRAGIAAVIADRLPARTWVDVYTSDSFNYDTTPVLRYAMQRLDASMVTEAAPDRASPPVIFAPAESIDRVVKDDHYAVYDVLDRQGNPLLYIAVRDDAPWADAIVKTTLAEYP